ncbi:YcaO-like family protein [Hyalangium rubrum]|uniref:YcaO-like family protein n=1 Tax=Hyalangium rubrum TaxID=3103134 RepID=A0ABU5HAE6_9BACT|nr:YcaO-like family protein [Hyalangium sp. s54d21]MDY7230451.1 YcaO-like family protein [Hyalangium sp. s54d21]
MSLELPKAYMRGTHRVVSPETTLERIRPHLRSFGITRCADITGLDCTGIPVYVAIRPQGRVLQTSNGKGLRHVDAQVSALMESIEHWHAENPAVPFHRASLGQLRRDGARIVSPESLEGFWSSAYFTEDQVLDWVQGEDLHSGEALWLPAFTAYYYRHQHHRYSFNGLASGNHLTEATLHSLYELIERDTLSRLSEGNRIHLGRCDVIDLDTVTDEVVGVLREQVERSELRLVLLRAPSELPTHTFMAVLLDSSPFSHASTVNLGYGAHLSPSVAATRAITEAAQSRLTFIHGSRDDLSEAAYQGGGSHQRLYSFFSQLTPDTSWDELEERSSHDLTRDYQHVLESLQQGGFQGAYRVNLSQRLAEVVVVKVMVPGARLTISI